MQRLGSLTLLSLLAGGCGTARVVFPVEEETGLWSVDAPPVDSGDPDEDPAARLELSTRRLLFGEVPQECLVRGVLALHNTGEAEAVVEQVLLRGDPQWELRVRDALPIRLEPGAGTALDVRFTPTDDAEYSAEILIRSSAEEAPLRALAAGRGGYDRQVLDRHITPDLLTDVVLLPSAAVGMADDLDRLEARVPELLAMLDHVAPNWQVSVIDPTTGCSVHGAPITAEQDNAVEALRGSINRVRVQTQLGASHALLDLGKLALYNARIGGCNEGAVRADSMAHLLLFSDTDDTSGEDPQLVVEDLEALVAEPELLRISAIAGDPEGGCVRSDPALIYSEAVALTGGAFLPLCEDWQGFIELAEISTPPISFGLSQLPEVGSLRVSAGGTVLPSSQWQLLPEEPAVHLNSAPLAGAVVDLSYLSATCP